MNWFVIVVVAICLLIHQYLLAIVVVIAYWLWGLVKKPSGQISQENTHYPEDTSDLSAGDLADLVLLRLELQSLADSGQIDSEQQASLNQQIDALCTDYLADLKAVRNNALWQKHRDDAWNLLNVYAESPQGLPPWRIAKDQKPDAIVTSQSDFSKPITPVLNETQAESFATETEADLSSNIQPSEQTANFTLSEIPITTEAHPAELSITSEAAETFTLPDVPIPATPLANEFNTAKPASLIVETDFSTPINPFTAESNSDNSANAQAASFAIDEEDHTPVPPAPQTVSPKVKQAEPTLNQYAWKPHEPSRLERALKTVSGWHSMAVPFLAQNIGWFIGVFCFIAGSIFLVEKTKGYTSNLIAFSSFFIFTLALLFGGYQLRRKRPELDVSSYVIFILSLLLIPLTNITGTQLLINSDGSILKLLFGSLLVLAELGVFYFAVTLVSGLMDRSLQQGLPKFFLALTAMQLLQVLLLNLPFWQLLIVIHLLIFALLSVSIYLFANQWLQAIFVDQHKIAWFAAGTLIYAAVVSFVFITAGNSITLPAGYYGFFLMLLCGLLFFIDAQLKQWTEQHAYLSRFSFLVYGLSVLALCLVAQHPIAIPTLVLGIALYAFIVWRYLTLTPLTILLACYFWLYGALVLQALPNSWHFLASLPVLFSLYKAAHWALNKRQSAYLVVIIYRVLYSLLAGLTIWSLYHSEAGLLAMATAIIASVLVYYTLKAAPVAIFSSYAQIASSEDVINRLSKKYNLLSSHWFYTIPALGVVTVYYTPRLLTDSVQFSLGLSLLAVFWAYRGLTTFFKAHSSSETTSIEQGLNSALLSLLLGVLPLFSLWSTDKLQLVAPLFLVAIILFWLSYQLLTRWLFYLTLLTFALAYLPLRPLKALYFPTPSGLGTMLLGIGLWFWLWYAERRESSELMTLKREQVSQKIALLPSCRLLGRYRLPSPALLFRDVINTPLEQVMCLFWLLGMKTLVSRFMDNHLSYTWLAAVFCAGLFSLLLIARYSLIKLLPVPIALVLTAVLMMLKFWGVNTDGLLLASGLFALACWQVVNYSLTQTFFIKLVNSFSPALPSEIQEIGKITHHSAFFIVLVGVILQLFNAANTHSFMVLLTLITTAGFLWLSNSVYQQIIVRYLVLGFSVLAGIELVSLTLHPFTWLTLSTDSYAALLFTLLSLAVGVLVLTPTASYTKPAAITAISLVFAGIFLQIQHVINITGSVITPLDYTVLFLAGISLLLASVKQKWIFCHFSAFMIFALAVLWLEHSVFHAQQPFSLWLGKQTFPDLWLSLGLLSLAMSLLSHNQRFTQKVDVCYLPPLNTVATISFAWALLGTLTLFFATTGQAKLLAWSLLVLLLALFSLTKNRSGAEQIRGFASASLLAFTVFSVLRADSIGFSLQAATVTTGYTLWCCASLILPRFNKRFSVWAIEPLFFPYAGFLLLVLAGYWYQPFNDVNMGTYSLALSVYSLLMLRYGRWMIFSWLSTLTFAAAILCLENSIVTDKPLLLSFGEQHSWLILGLLSLAMSLLAHKLKATQKWAELHCLPLNTVAIVCFVGSLLGTLSVFFASKAQAGLLAGSFVCLLLALFSLTKNRSSEAESRGFGSACLLTLTAFSLLPVGFDGFELQSATVLLGYALWCFASFVLPRFNKHFSDWTITPLSFPYLGFLLVTFSSYWLSAFTDFSLGIYCLELTIYCVLMWRYSRWQGFAWLANFAFVAAVLCLENSFAHPNQTLVLLPGDQKLLGSWLMLGLLSLSLSMLSHRLKAWQAWAEVYCLPLSSVATLCFAGSLAGTLSLFFMGSAYGVILAGIFLVLLLASFSLSKDSADAAKIRGFATANFLALIAFSFLPSGLNAFALQIMGYALWLLATLILPRFNQRYSAWTIAPNFFPWLGLLLVLFSAACWQELNAVEIGIYCLELSVYALLMLRYSNWAGFSWLSAFAFTAAGVAFNIDNDLLPYNLLLWGNLQLLIVTLWQRKGEKLAERWQWQSPPLAQAFTVCTQFILLSYLLVASIVFAFLLIDGVYNKDIMYAFVLPINILLNLSLLHLLGIRFSRFSLHSFIYSLFLCLWAIYFTYLNTLFQPPLLIALWSVVLLAVSKIRIAKHAHEISNAVGYWLRASVIIATLSLLTYNGAAIGELLLALAIVAGLSAALAGKSTNSAWLVLARIEFLLVLHAWPCLLVGFNAQNLQLLLPWYALQSTLLAALSMAFLQRLLTTPMNDEDKAYYTQVLKGTAPNPLDALAALGTGVIISLIGLRHVRHTPDSNWLYGIVILIGALGFYARLFWLGAASPSLWDTASIIGFAYILFFLQGLFPSKPLYNTALFMPVLALLTVPLQLATPETSMTLMATGLLYLMVRRHSQQKIPLYLALLAFNAGVYLWIPNLAKESQLIQVYVIPAALSVLLLLHLHSRELKPSVLMGSRLAALSSIYACATADVFLSAEAQQLGVFILAMVLSMAGILLGIALRTRAFLYAGISFLLLNVLGQLRLPQQEMGKAIVLMVMGAIITGFMIWFSIKRVEILQRLSAIQAKMETWE